MSLLHEYNELQEQLKVLQEKMGSLESNKDMKRELEFKEKVDELLIKYNKVADDLIEIYAPKQPKKSTVASKQARRPRKLKIYKNPNTGEVVETYGGNNKVLRDWKDEHGAEAVEGWLIQA